MAFFKIFLRASDFLLKFIPLKQIYKININYKFIRPGIGYRKQFKKIFDEDVYILIKAELEKIQLEYFKELVLEKI